MNGRKLDECADSRKKRVVGNFTTYVEFVLHLLSFISFPLHSTILSFIPRYTHVIHR